MTLEALSHTLEIECGWIQMISAESSNLELVAHRGFHFKDRLENVILDVRDVYHREIIGLGNSLVIPNLRRNDTYIFSTLNSMGYRWLVAVPMRNHRLAGVMSITSRLKRKIDNNFVDLIAVVAGLAFTAHEKSSEKLRETGQHEASARISKNNSSLEVYTDELFSLNSDLGGQVTESSPRETDLLDAIYSGKDADRIAARFNSDVETVRNDIASIRNKLLENYQTRSFTKTIQQDNFQDHLLNRERSSSKYVTREEFNEFKESLKAFFENTLTLLDDL
jgi:hypothetical protein